MKTILHELENGDAEYIETVETETIPNTPKKTNDNTLVWVLLISILVLAVLFYLQNKNKNNGNTGSDTK